MAGYQILGIRSFFDETTRKQKKYDAFFEQRWRFDDFAAMLQDPKKVLDENKVPESERWNLFYTVAVCGDAKRSFSRGEILPFDIDGLDISRRDEYIAPVIKTLKLDINKTAIVFSGNGLHFLVKLYPALDEKGFYNERRGQYKAICGKINAEFERLRLPGKADTAVFDPARILRFPLTLNRKPDKQDPSKLIERLAEVIQATLEPQVFDFDKISEQPKLDATQAIPIESLKKYKTNDGVEAFKNCNFLKHVKENAASIPEPEWYAAASIIGRFDKGREQFHDLSRAYPGYRAGETDEKLDQALASSGPRTCEGIDQVWGGCKSCPLYQKISSPVVIFGKDVIPTEATGFYDLIVSKEGAIKRVPNYKDLLAAFVRKHPYKTIADMRSLFIFNKTHYVDYTPIEVKAFAEHMFHPDPTNEIRSEFNHKVFANHLEHRTFFTQSIEDKINFANGVLDLNSKTIVEHSPEYGFRAVLPYNFAASQACPVFDKWIDEIMLGDKELVAILQEFMGYVVRGGEYKYHKALWLSGSGRNGKSTFLDILKALIGPGNFAVLSIKQIIQDKFASTALDGKIANFSEETSPEELADSGPFKNLTGDGDMSAQKKYGDVYQFRNRAKLIMSYNEVPILKDLSPGMLSRPIIIPFKLDLSDEASQDKTLRKKLMAELPGIFNFALRGWERLEAQGQFSKSKKSTLEMDEIREASCSAAAWARENLEFLGTENSTQVRPIDIYTAYKATVQSPYFEQKFYKRINALPQVASRRRRNEKGVHYVALKVGKKSDNSGEY